MITLVEKQAVVNQKKDVILSNKMEFNRIYLLTDFSEHARNACKYAIDAFGLSVDYFLINTFSVRGGAATLIDIEELAHQESLDDLKREVEMLKDYVGNFDFKIDYFSKNGSTVDGINNLLEDFPAELVVVGSKGISKLDDFLIGSVTASIMRGVSKPVLAVPISAKYQQMDRIVLASDLLNSSKPSVVDTLKMLKDKFHSSVSSVTVRQNAEELSTEENEMLSALSANEVLDNVVVLSEANVSKSLMDYCKNHEADMLVIVAKHTSFFKRFFHKSVTKELVNHEILPILVLEDN